MSRMPARWLGVRNCFSPLIWAASVRLAPLAEPPAAPAGPAYRQMPGTGGITHAAQSIVKAHGTLAHGCPVPGCGLRIERAHGLRCREKQVEVVAFHPQHGPVKHGVDIVRPALEGAGSCPRRLSAASRAQVSVVLPLPEQGAATRNWIICVLL